MKTPVLILITAVLGIAIGFTVGKGGSSNNHDAPLSDQADPVTRKSQASRGSSDRKAASTSEGILAGVLKGREISQLSADDALKLLAPRISMDWNGDPLEMARNNYELQLLLSKLPASVLEQVIELSRKSDTPGFRVQQLFSAYATRDWQKAMDWAERQPDAARWKSAAIGKLAASDPARAAELYQDGRMNGTLGRSATWESGYNIANAYAKQGLQPFLSFLDTLPSGDVSNLLANSSRNLPKADIAAFLQEVGRRTADGSLDKWAMNNLVSNLAQTNPDEARKWIDSQEAGETRSKLELSLASNLARQGKSDEVLPLLKSAMAGVPGKEKEFFTSQIGTLLQTNPAIINQLADNLPAGTEFTGADLKNASTYGRNDAMVDLAKLIKNSDEQVAYLKQSLENLSNNGSKLNEVDFQLLSHRLQSLPITGSSTAVQEALANARQKALGK